MATTTFQFPELLEPFVTDIFFNKLNMIPPIFPQVFNVRGSNRGFEEMLRVAGLGTFADKPEGTPVSYDDPVQGNRVRTVHTTFALGFRVTMEMMDDDQHGIIRQMPSDLADSARDHRENLAFSLFADAFAGATFRGLDGLALCVTHTNLKTGETQNNALAPGVALSVSGLQSALTNMRTTTNESGRFIQLRPRMLLIHPNEEFNAAQILDSEKLPGSADNDINSVRSSRIGVSALMSQYLTDTTDWFLLAEKMQHSLTWWNRKDVTMERSRDAQTKDQLFDSHYRASIAVYDWRGVVGSAAP